jgi:hypothetical protein
LYDELSFHIAGFGTLRHFIFCNVGRRISIVSTGVGPLLLPQAYKVQVSSSSPKRRADRGLIFRVIMGVLRYFKEIKDFVLVLTVKAI